MKHFKRPHPVAYTGPPQYPEKEKGLIVARKNYITEFDTQELKVELRRREALDAARVIASGYAGLDPHVVLEDADQLRLGRQGWDTQLEEARKELEEKRRELDEREEVIREDELRIARNYDNVIDWQQNQGSNV